MINFERGFRVSYRRIDRFYGKTEKSKETTIHRYNERDSIQTTNSRRRKIFARHRGYFVRSSKTWKSDNLEIREQRNIESWKILNSRADLSTVEIERWENCRVESWSHLRAIALASSPRNLSDSEPSKREENVDNLEIRERWNLEVERSSDSAVQRLKSSENCRVESLSDFGHKGRERSGYRWQRIEEINDANFSHVIGRRCRCIHTYIHTHTHIYVYMLTLARAHDLLINSGGPSPSSGFWILDSGFQTRPCYPLYLNRDYRPAASA